MSQRVMFLPKAASEGLVCLDVSKNKIKRILAPGKLCTKLASNCSSCSGMAEALFKTQNWVAKIFLRPCMACANDWLAKVWLKRPSTSSELVGK